LPLFDNFNRSFEGPIAAGESSFGYLNRSARPEVDRIRAFLATCFDRYPAAHQAEMRARIRSDNRVHEAAVFELIVHELLLRAGHTILAIEPALEHTTKSPDFLVQSSGGERFYVECAVATGQSDAEAAANKRLQQALEAAESTPSPHHVLSLDIDGLPTGSLTLSRLRQQLAAWIQNLPMSEDATTVPGYRYEEHGVALTFTVWRYQEAARADGERSVGITHYGVRSTQIGADLRGALLRKAKRYGELDAPYVVAVNTLEIRSLERELFDVLLGTTKMVFRRYEDGRVETFDERAPDGIWTNGSRPRKRGLSAVWNFDRLAPWRPWAASVQLVRNPWAERPLPQINLLCEEWNPVEDEFRRSGTTKTREALGLAETWPEID
jgi:hypothetical protein